MTRLQDLEAVTYRLIAEPPGHDITLERVRQSCGPDRWAVRRLRSCLNRSGEWEYEPQPSSRDDAFFARWRTGTPEEALAAWDLVQAKGAAR